MPTVRIVQLLCPERHCILATAYESEDGAADSLMSKAVNNAFDSAVERRVLNPWCDLCHSRILHTEDAATGFSTLEEARPFLDASQRSQRAAAEQFRLSKN